MFARIVIDMKNDHIDDYYDYLIPENLMDFVKVGTRVLVSFGFQDLLGYVIELTDESKYASNIKPSVTLGTGVISGNSTFAYIDFEDENTGNELIDVRLNNAYRKSKKIYQVTANSCSYNKAEANLSLAVQENRDSKQASALACLVNEGTVATVAGETISDKAVDARKQLRKEHAKPDVVFASVDAFAEMLKEAGSKYTPSTNDRIITTGQVGHYLGMTWFEVDALEGVAKYFGFDSDETAKEVNLDDVDLIVYDHTALKVADNLNMMRLKDSERFTGVLAQNEINSGFRVSNAKKVAVVKKSA